MGGWGEYAAAWAVFLLSHAVPVRPPVKPWLVARLGRAGFTLAYSMLSVLMLIWLIVAAGRAPYVELWSRAEWQNHVTFAAMSAACLIAALAAFRPNPLSFGGWRDEEFDPARAGVVGLIRHPFLAALALWALGHLAPNGDLSHALMFGGFSGFALLGMRMIDRRKKRELGMPGWTRLVARRRPNGMLTLSRVAAALAILAALVLLHPVVIGPPVLIW